VKRSIKKVALINPAKPRRSSSAAINAMFEKCKKFIRPWFIPPLNLLTIASYFPPDTEIDFKNEDLSTIDLSKEYDFVALTSMTLQAPRAYEIARTFRHRKIPIAIGGIHPTVVPEEASRYADYVFLGEAEKTLPKFLDEFKAGSPKSLYQMPQDEHFDLRNALIPRYDLLKNDQINKGQDYFNMIPVQATRGCPHDCSFCIVSKMHGKRIRKKEVSQILKEIRTIQRLFGNRLIVFVDDNLFIDKQFAKSLLVELIPLKIRFCAQSDIGIAEDEELLQLAYRAGLQVVLIGFESLEKESLFKLDPVNWKYNHMKYYEGAVNTIQDHGIIVYGTFIIGFEHDTKDTFPILRNFLIKNHCNAQFSFLTPFPGTKLFQWALEDGRISSAIDWGKFSFDDIMLYSDNIGKKATEDGLIWLYNEIYDEKAFSDRANHLKKVLKKLPARWNLR
jgi:radical SAM superfamily enzyme YgiQ (UPF0313 family)